MRTIFPVQKRRRVKAGRMERAVRKYWTHVKLPFVTDLVAEKVWKAKGWVEKSGDVPVFAAWRGGGTGAPRV